MSMASLSSAWAEPWSKAYVSEWFEPAMYYGASEGTDYPGTDCPQGTMPEVNRRELLKTSYRTYEEVDKIMDPEKPMTNRYLGIRGPNGENVYKEPWVAPDPGLWEVEGDIAFGFDLDGNPETGFTSPAGQPGIDNEYYRTAGCWMSWRGPERSSHHAKYINDGMRDGVYTIAVVLSGNDSPENDADAKMAFYLSKDKLVKDASGNIAPDYTFRVDPDERFQTVVPVSIDEGVVTSKAPRNLNIRNVESARMFPSELVLHDAQLQFSPNDAGLPGAMTGYIGGYRSTEAYWKGWAAAGSIHEAVTHIDLVGYWYGLQRNADYKIDPESEKNDAISTAYRMFLIPAFVSTPSGSEQVTSGMTFTEAVSDASEESGRGQP